MCQKCISLVISVQVQCCLIISGKLAWVQESLSSPTSSVPTAFLSPTLLAPTAFSSSTLPAPTTLLSSMLPKKTTAFLVLIFHVAGSKIPNNHPVIYITTIAGSNSYIVVVDISFKRFINKESGRFQLPICHFA
ncbi:hypothetical protein LSAT2_006538, partial [Lamellibrachia satsuma]